MPSIEEGSFWDCPLTNVTIGSSVTNIATWGFIDCFDLTSVTIPAGVASLGTVAFSGCTSLQSVYFLGNAPSGDSTVFSGDNNVTAYYLPGTTGWAQFAADTGIPIALWTTPFPLVLHGSVGARANQFGFTVSWATNLSVVVQACTDLANPVWQALQTNTMTNGTFYFSDPHGRIIRRGSTASQFHKGKLAFVQPPKAGLRRGLGGCGRFFDADRAWIAAAICGSDCLTYGIVKVMTGNEF